jgi:hypothetical protein
MARSVDLIGEWGSLLILREAFSGVRRFDEFQKTIGISRNLLTTRLTRVADTARPDGEFESASAAFSEKELVDLTIAIGLINAYNRLAIGFRKPPKAAT